jgi:thiamine-phosphate pyrophosphorylase
MRRKIAGLYAITPDEAGTESLVRKVAHALSGGASVVQYRNKAAGAELRREQGRALAALCRRAGACFIVNDDLALALELDADGVHLGVEDGDLTAARVQLGTSKLLGASCYDRIDLAQAAAQANVDYLAFGSVFGSITKPRRCARRSPSLPRRGAGFRCRWWQLAALPCKMRPRCSPPGRMQWP